jgi:hypothetical protein
MRSSSGCVLAYDIERESILRIRLTRKLALRLNGLDLSGINVGDVVFLPEPDAAMLLREGWAERVDS